MNKDIKYNHSPKGIARNEKYEQTDKARIRKLRYEYRPHEKYVLEGRRDQGRSASRIRTYFSNLRQRIENKKQRIAEYERYLQELLEL